MGLYGVCYFGARVMRSAAADELNDIGMNEKNLSRI